MQIGGPAAVRSALAIVALAAGAGALGPLQRAWAQEEARLVPFALPWDAASPGPAAAAVRPPRPAGRSGFVETRGGHFYSGAERLRLLGVNVCFGACFPPHEVAAAVARRMASFGINCVRFHHMDSSPFPRGIWSDERRVELAPEALDRLDYFIAELARAGIYADLNLHVSHKVSQTLGLAQARALPGMDKMIALFHPRIRVAIEDYARALLTHVNPYTRRAYREEPAVALVEISNENSMFMWGARNRLIGLPPRYRALLEKLWNRWLAERYPTREKLAAAWSAGAEPAGENLLGGSFDRDLETIRRSWTLEQHDGSRMDLARVAGPGGEDAVRLTIARRDEVSWHLQFLQGGMQLERGQVYSISFQARAEAPRKISVGCQQHHAPWNNLGFARELALGPAWKEHAFSFRARASDANARLSFSLGSAGATVELAAVRFTRGGVAGLRREESPAAGNVRLLEAGGISSSRRADELRFFHHIDEDFFLGLRRFLREELKVRMPVTGTISFGPVAGEVQARTDFVDAHAYWQHPRFPGRPWDGRNWLIANTPMVAERDGGTLLPLALARVAGRPFTVSEYNHPAPADCQVECVPLLAAFAAHQDWDGIFLFAYNHDRSYAHDAIHGFFDIDLNPAKMALLPIAALMLRGGYVPPAREALPIPVNLGELIAAGTLSSRDLLAKLRAAGWGPGALFAHRLELRYGAAAPLPAPAGSPPGSTWRSDSGALRFERTAGRERLVAATPRLVSITGFLRGASERREGLELRLPETGAAFGTFDLASLDGRPLATSRSMLLVALGRVENSGQRWNAARTSLSDHWGTGPTRIEPIAAELRLAGALRAFALDGCGRRMGEAPRELRGGATLLRLGAAPTPWYEIVRAR